MASVIEALVVTLGLDPAAFVKGQKQAMTSFAKTRESAVKEGKGIERSLDSASEAVERLSRNALKLFAVFTGGRALGTFITDIGRADAAMGRMADRLGVTPQRIAAFDNAVKRAGGSAGEGAAAFQSLSDTIGELRLTGNASAFPALVRLQGISQQQIRLNGTLEQSFGDLAAAAQGTAAKSGASTASLLLRQAGFSESTINLLLQGRAAVEKALSKSAKSGLVSKADSDAARALGEQYEDLSDKVADFGRKISTALTPVLTDLMRRFGDWLDQNKQWLKDDIVGEVSKFATELRKIPWDDVGKGIKEFVEGANRGAQAVGGWTRVAEIFFGLWAVSKVAGVLAQIGLIRAALVAGDTSLLAAMARVGLPVAIGAVAMGHGFQTPEQAAADPDQAELQREGIDRRERFRGTVRRGWNRVKRFFGGGSSDEAEGDSGGMRPRARRGLNKLAQSGNVRAITAELQKAGYGDNAVAAVVGSMETESTFNPRAHNDQSGGHTGLWQWDRTRWPKIKRWIESQGGDPYDAAWQTKAWVAEHNAKPGDAIYDHPRTERGGAILRNNPTIEQAIHGVRESERFGPGEEGGRARHAREWLPQIQQAKDIATIQAGARRPEVLADPNDERRKPMASLMYGDTPPAARSGASAVVAQALSAQADRLASISNDNRSSSTSTAEAHFHGDMIFNNSGDSREIASNLRARLKEPQFVQAVNYGQG